ncbi:hypothetical protein NA56DRAFT_322421 [Hyaloscypha hepaticicola]|uniref:Uncharacterized protein n=1 Tax=Hyaloscypha hepaticicola TaxID=2082293 RepID=A0A2J6PQ38_9HELO|nr:hypothetical protein NA56DRAFT_322421 [Hyaloscypha hepaticicola]
MCFYDLNQWSCGDSKWGHFRQHCSREYRTGESCGLKLVMARYQMEEKCKCCQKMETKYRRIRKEQERINRWRKEGGRSASI